MTKPFLVANFERGNPFLSTKLIFRVQNLKVNVRTFNSYLYIKQKLIETFVWL